MAAIHAYNNKGHFGRDARIYPLSSDPEPPLTWMLHEKAIKVSRILLLSSRRVFAT